MPQDRPRRCMRVSVAAQRRAQALPAKTETPCLSACRWKRLNEKGLKKKGKHGMLYMHKQIKKKTYV